MPSPSHSDRFVGLKGGSVTIFSDRTRWQKRCIDIIPDCVERADQAFGSTVPHVHFHLFARHADFTSYFQELFGSKPRSWQTGTGTYLKEQAIVLLSDKGKRAPKQAELGIVMHEYSHALFWARYSDQRIRIPTWLDEGFADYLAMPWYPKMFESTPEIIRRQAIGRRLPTYHSFARSIYAKPKAGYGIARLMVIELMRDQQLDTIAYVLDEAKRRKGGFTEVIKEVCGLSPKQLYEKVLADCQVAQPAPVRRVNSSPERKCYWTCWGSRAAIPSTFHECLLDLYFWKLEHYGRNYHEQEVNSHRYPHWNVFAMAYLRFLKDTNFGQMTKNELDEVRAMPRLDPCGRLFAYVSKEEIVSSLWQSLPLDTTDYLAKCIENVSDLDVRDFLRKELACYLQRCPPIVDTTAMQAFTNEFAMFTSYRVQVLDGDAGSTKYNRWQELARAFVCLLKDRTTSSWSQTLHRYMQSLISHDEHGYMPTFISRADLKHLLSGYLPGSLRQYLSVELI